MTSRLKIFDDEDLEQRVAAALPPSVDQIEVFPLQMLVHHRDILRVVLQVRVQRHDPPAGGVLEPARERG